LTDRVDHDSTVGVGEDADVVAVTPVDEVVDETGVEVVVVARRVALVVVEESAMAGAATFRGAMGRSLTWSSAALTICQVRVVASPTTTSQPKKRVNRLTPGLSQTSPAGFSTQYQGCIKPGLVVARQE
jgi:hypothetical protein